MQLEYICDMELAYREEPLYGEKVLLVRPYGGEEGTGYTNRESNQLIRKEHL